MREQPNQPNTSRSFPTFRRFLSGFRAESISAPALFLGASWQPLASVPMPLAGESSLTLILAVLAGALGLSASILYRHMHQRELELRSRAANAEAELRALLMMTDDAVLVVSEDGSIRATNPASEELFERTSDDFLGEPLTEIIVQPLCLAELTKHGPVNFATTAKRSGDRYSRVEMLLSPVELSGRTGYLAIVQKARVALPDDSDASDRKSLSKAVEKFTHDLNNQLTGVLGNLSLILMASPGDPTSQSRILNAKKTALQAQSLSQKLQLLVQEGDEEDALAASAPEINRTIVQMPSMQPTVEVSPPQAASRPSRILILDDEEAICALVADVLDASGFEVTGATTVPAALKACQEAKDSGDPFALVICDLSLPGGMNGTQATARLREIDPDIRAIVSSGHNGDPIMCDCRKFGFMAAIAKPYELSQLVRAVGEVLAADSADIRKSA